MNRNRSDLVSALAVGAAVLIVGCALVLASAKRTSAEERGKALEIVANSCSASQAKLEELSGLMEAMAAQLGPGSSADDLARNFTAAAQKLLPNARLYFVSAGLDHHEPSAGTRDSLYEEFRAQDRTPELPSPGTPARSGGVQWLAPVLNSGEWFAVLRTSVPTNDGTGTPQFEGWIVAAVPVETLLRAGGVERLGSAGFDFQLEYLPSGSGRPQVVARSTDFQLDAPVKHALFPVPSSAPGEWNLLAAPQKGWMPWLPIAAQCVLVVLLAVLGGLVLRGSSHQRAELHEQIQNRDRRLKALNQRLAEEIEQREKVEGQFSHASSHDPFTGLPNRSYFLERLARALGRARLRPGYIVAVILVQLDRFTSVRETLGAPAGDELLAQTVRRLELCLRPEDPSVARVADDQLAMLLFDIGSAHTAEAAAKRLQDALQEPFEIQGTTVFTSAVMGIALGISGYEDAEELVRGAHMALSKAKTEGLVHYALFDPATREQVVTRNQMETDLHAAIQREEFFLNFQPIISFDSGMIAGIEVLLRWQHPLEGLVPPARFVPLAEETGLIVPITRWVLRKACEQASEWHKRFPSDLDFYISVNFSAQDLRQPDVCDIVAAALEESGLPPSMLRLEVTESFMIDNLGAVSEIVARFRKLGVALLLDDFGTGYSSLSYLTRMHFDYIKIDRAFVSRIITTEKQNTGIVSAIVHMATDLGSKTIAEGVETFQTFQQLRALGCNYGQGYYFSKPLEADAAERLLLTRPQWNSTLAAAAGAAGSTSGVRN